MHEYGTQQPRANRVNINGTGVLASALRHQAPAVKAAVEKAMAEAAKSVAERPTAIPKPETK